MLNNNININLIITKVVENYRINLILTCFINIKQKSKHYFVQFVTLLLSK